MVHVRVLKYTYIRHKIYDMYIQNRLVEYVNALNIIKITLRKIDKLLIRNIIIINLNVF